MVFWKVVLSNDVVFDELSIEEIIGNSEKVTPWVLLDKYCEQNNVSIKSIVLWDQETHQRVYSPGAYLGTVAPDSIEFRRRYTSESFGTNSPIEFSGLIIKKDTVSLGVWINSKTKEVHTTIEYY
jgi:hypothetical protein